MGSFRFCPGDSDRTAVELRGRWLQTDSASCDVSSAFPTTMPRTDSPGAESDEVRRASGRAFEAQAGEFTDYDGDAVVIEVPFLMDPRRPVD